MSVFINVSGTRFIECNVCGCCVPSIHGNVISNTANDIPPTGWETEQFKRPAPFGGFNYSRSHYCPDCNGSKSLITPKG